MTFQDIDIWLKEFSVKHDLVNTALESCLTAVSKCRRENPDEGFPLDETELRLDKQEFVFNHCFLTKLHVKTQIGLFHRMTSLASECDSDKYGYYVLDTDENGNHFDDWLVYKSNS